MLVRAITRFIRVSPDRARNVADLIRGVSVSEAVSIIRYTPTRAARVVEGTLNSAIANAKAKKIEDVDSMKVEEVTVDGGPIIRRFIARAMGRATRIRKRTAHITIILNEVPKKLEDAGQKAESVAKKKEEKKATEPKAEKA